MQIVFVIPEEMEPVKNGKLDGVIVHVNPEIELLGVFDLFSKSPMKREISGEVTTLGSYTKK
jgi:hypothetical protein